MPRIWVLAMAGLVAVLTAVAASPSTSSSSALMSANAAHPPSLWVEIDKGVDPPPTTTTTAAPTTTTTDPPPTTTTTAAPLPPPPPPPPQPTTGEPSGECGGWRAVIAAHFPTDQIAKACSVMLCESGGNFQAENQRSSASGGWQFLSGTWERTTGTPAPASAYSADTQTAAAAKLWASSGWSQWSCA